MEEEANNYTYIIIIERIKREPAERSLKTTTQKNPKFERRQILYDDKKKISIINTQTDKPTHTHLSNKTKQNNLIKLVVGVKQT